MNQNFCHRLKRLEDRLTLGAGLYRVIVHRWDGTQEETVYPTARPGEQVVHIRYVTGWPPGRAQRTLSPAEGGQ